MVIGIFLATPKLGAVVLAVAGLVKEEAAVLFGIVLELTEAPPELAALMRDGIPDLLGIEEAALSRENGAPRPTGVPPLPRPLPGSSIAPLPLPPRSEPAP